MIPLLIAAAALVPLSKGPVQVYSFPDRDSCGSWTEERRSGNGRWQGYEGWILGFITGLNWFGENSGNVAPGVNGAGLIAWVDNYCAAHPLDNMGQAGFALARELHARGR